MGVTMSRPDAKASVRTDSGFEGTLWLFSWESPVTISTYGEDPAAASGHSDSNIMEDKHHAPVVRRTDRSMRRRNLRESTVKRIFAPFAAPIIVLLAAACGPAPRFINHPRPDLSVDFNAFADAGCLPDESGRMVCGPESPLAAFGCDRLEAADDLMGGLDPALPIAYCVYDPDRHPDGGPGNNSEYASEGYFFRSGGLIQVYIRFVVFMEGKYRVLKNPEEFAEVFAPVDSADEALGFALTAGPYTGYYGLKREPGFRYLSDVVEDTHVDETKEGYAVHLFFYQTFGCGPHTTSSAEITVTKSGTVELVTTVPMFQDPKEDNVCVD
jgi:hypothetical protein